jgi:hypothetical protein
MTHRPYNKYRMWWRCDGGGADLRATARAGAAGGHRTCAGGAGARRSCCGVRTRSRARKLQGACTFRRRRCRGFATGSSTPESRGWQRARKRGGRTTPSPRRPSSASSSSPYRSRRLGAAAGPRGSSRRKSASPAGVCPTCCAVRGSSCIGCAYAKGLVERRRSIRQGAEPRPSSLGSVPQGDAVGSTWRFPRVAPAPPPPRSRRAPPPAAPPPAPSHAQDAAPGSSGRRPRSGPTSRAGRRGRLWS